MLKPMLACNADISSLRFPLLASPKLDGVRALVRDGVVYSRSGKPIPNAHVQKTFGHLHGYDGELIAGEPNAQDVFRKTQSAVMSQDGRPDVTFHVFDNWTRGNAPYGKWYGSAVSNIGTALKTNVQLVQQVAVKNSSDIEAYEENALAVGFEGVMLRSLDGKYKNGRSTVREGILMKIKRFADAEAEIIDLQEEISLDGKPKGTLGAFVMRDMTTGVTFNIGTGFDDAERRAFWHMGSALHGKLARYRYFPTGEKDRPRFPVFAGLRNRADTDSAA
jgi:DNA ligase-1